MSPKNNNLYAYTKLCIYTNEIMDYLEIPKKGNEDMIHQEGNGEIINQKRILGTLYNFIQGDNQSWKDYVHSLKVGRGALFIIEYLGIKDPELRKTIFTSFILHDTGKIPMLDLFHKRDFINEDFKRKSDHTKLDYIRQAFWPNPEDRNKLIFNNSMLESIIERHHFNRSVDSYPANPNHSETPEIKLYSSVLGIYDGWDSNSTRVNNSTKLSEEDKLAGRLTPSGKTIKDKLIQLYGNLPLEYDGEKINGNELIEDLYANIFRLSESSEEERLLQIIHK